MECAAEFGEMDPGMKGRVRTPRCWPKLGIELGEDRVLGTFLKTTQVSYYVGEAGYPEGRAEGSGY